VTLDSSAAGYPSQEAAGEVELAPLRREQARLTAARKVLLVAILVVVLNSIVPAVFTALPQSHLPDLPDPPGSIKWAWRALLIGLITVAVVDAITRGEDKRPDDG
jgi:hypothetical protein